MTIDKAIEILNNHQVDLSLTPATDLRDAVKLSIEALKRIKTYRHSIGWRPSILLPGESKD